MHFGHVLTAMVTPFDTQGEINFDCLTLLIEHLLENGTEGLVITGTTGESAVLSEAEMEMVFHYVVKKVNKRVHVLAGTGSNNTAQSIALTKRAQQCGVDGMMLVAPYYNRPNQAGMHAHFKHIAEATTLPVMLYNIPGRCGVHLEASTIISLSKINNIIAVKEASGDLNQVSEIVRDTADDFYVYSGDDSMTLPMMSVGAVGVVSVASHVIGNEMKEMVHAFLQGNITKARAIHLQQLSVMNGLFMAPSPAPVKNALRLKGLDVGSVRAPLVDLTKEELHLLKQIIL